MPSRQGAPNNAQFNGWKDTAYNWEDMPEAWKNYPSAWDFWQNYDLEWNEPGWDGFEWEDPPEDLVPSLTVADPRWQKWFQELHAAPTIEATKRVLAEIAAVRECIIAEADQLPWSQTKARLFQGKVGLAAELGPAVMLEFERQLHEHPTDAIFSPTGNDLRDVVVARIIAESQASRYDTPFRRFFLLARSLLRADSLPLAG